jgi:putative hydrolase of HD superfamily
MKYRPDNRLRKQFDFIIEIDAVKSILRKSRLFKAKRYENDAEHSWHFAVMAAVLSEYSNIKIDLLKVLKMALIHDIPEIYTGDVMVYKKGKKDEAKEMLSAKKIFSRLPAGQSAEFYALWREFEEKETPEAKFASALDRLEPVMLNYLNKGGAWKKHKITEEQVMGVNRRINNGSEKLWKFAESMIQSSFKGIK